jgi:dihydrofolate reductase
MRKVKYSVANSLDNFIARKDGEFDWILMNADYGMDKFFSSIDTMLIGRKTYEITLSHSAGSFEGKGDNSFKGIKSFVFSRTLKESPSKDVQVVSENAGEIVRSLKNKEGKDIWLMGGGELAKSLFDENLVDEISLSVHPILLGSGIPLFHEINRQIDLELMECKPHKNGVVQLFYRVKN